MGNPFVHAELMTTDLAKAKGFYKSLFAWELAETTIGPGKTYTLINVGEGVGGGMIEAQAPGQPSAGTPYALVDDVASMIEKAKSLGAQVYVGATEVADAGSFAIIRGPTGAPIGLWQPKTG